MAMEMGKDKKQEVPTALPEKLSNNDYGPTATNRLEQAKRAPMGSDSSADKKSATELKDVAGPQTDFRTEALEAMRRPDVSKLKG